MDREVSVVRRKESVKRNRRSSVEVYNGTYEMRLPRRKNSGAKSSVTKVSSSHIVYNTDDAAAKGDEEGNRAKDVGDESRLGRLSAGDLQTNDDNRGQEEEKEEGGKQVEKKGEGRTGKEAGGETGQKQEKEKGWNSTRDEETEKDEGRVGETLKSADVTAGDDVSDGLQRQQPHGVGDALRGLSAALESLQEQQRQQKSKLINGSSGQTCGKRSGSSQSASATISLQSSRRGSRAGTPDRSSSRGATTQTLNNNKQTNNKYQSSS